MQGKKSKYLLMLICQTTLLSISHSPHNALADEHNQTYSSLVSMHLSESERDTLSDISTVTGVITVYLDPVNIGNYPYVLASHFDRHSYVTGRIGYRQFDYGFTKSGEYIMTGGFGYGSNDVPISFYILYGTNAWQDREFNGNYLDINVDRTHAAMDYHITPTALINVEYHSYQGELINGSVRSDIDEAIYVLEYWQLIPLPNGRYTSYSVETNKIHNEEGTNTLYGARFNYYFDKYVSAGIGYWVESGEDLSEEGSRMTLNSQLYMNPWASFQFSVSKFSADIPRYDRDDMQFRLTVRF